MQPSPEPLPEPKKIEPILTNPADTPTNSEEEAIEMEYFPSQTLAQLLDKQTQGFVASYKKVLDIYQQVLAGVAHFGFSISQIVTGFDIVLIMLDEIKSAIA